MTDKLTAFDPDLLKLFHEKFIRNDVEYMSKHLLGMPYQLVKKIIYPRTKYRKFNILKRNGSLREIAEPEEPLKALQLKVLAFLKYKAGAAKSCVHGFTNNRSIVTNAEKHCDDQTFYLLNIDIKDFFPSINFFRIRGLLQKKPFEFSHNVATVLAQLCTFQNQLPQGAPTSPILSNLICRSLDSDLMTLAKRHRANYTRYADDITFSFSVRDVKRLPPNICRYENGELILGQELQIIFAKNSFNLNQKKSRLSYRPHRLEVTGITINEFPNVKRIFIDKIRGALNAWEAHGYILAEEKWQMMVSESAKIPYEKRSWKRQWHSNGVPRLKNVLWGKLLYLRMVRGKTDVIYTRLAELYNRLCVNELVKDESFIFSRLPVEQIVRNGSDAERAVFVVEWLADSDSGPVGGQGTAFAYISNNCLVTCDHVFIDASTEVDCSAADISNLTLTVHNPAFSNNKWDVRITRRDAGRDLAILEFVNSSPVTRYFPKVETPIKKHQNGSLIGFPNWSPGRTANHVSAKVSSRYARSALQRFEISTIIRKGSSGGPFVDDSFQIKGVAQQGATQACGNDECLCVQELNAWIVKP